MITIKIKFAAVVTAFAVLACMQSVSAETAENITVLGDSISTGYGLDDDELSYCGYLQEYFDADLDNFAKDGRQTAELIEQLENDADVRSSVEQADLICVSIGGNDVLQIFLDSLSELKNAGGNNSEEQFVFSQEFVQGFIMKYASAFGPAAAQAGENIAEIRKKISELNPEAPIIMQTVYNPFETDNEKERYKAVRQAVNDFVGSLNTNISTGLESWLLQVWHNDIFINGTKEDPSIQLSKKEIIWPILVHETEISRCDDDSFLSQFDVGVYDDVVKLYGDIINSCCERIEFFTRVLYDYIQFPVKKSMKEKCNDFIEYSWEQYKSEFVSNKIDEETSEALTKIVLYNIIHRRNTIDKIKQGVNL